LQTNKASIEMVVIGVINNLGFPYSIFAEEAKPNVLRLQEPILQIGFNQA